MHQHCLLIIPANIYENGPEAIMNYIYEKLKPYNSSDPIPPYIEKTKENLQKAYEKYKSDCNLECTLEEYCRTFDYQLDEYGNLISTYNHEGFYDYYIIHNRWYDKPNEQPFDFERKLYDELQAELLINKNNHVNIRKIVAKYYALSLDIVNIQNNSVSVRKLLEEHMVNNNTHEIILSDVEKYNYQTVLENHINDYVIQIDFHS